MQPYYEEPNIQIYLGYCLEVLKEIPERNIDLILTDPTYPDYNVGYKLTSIDFLKDFPCRQFIFWSAKCEFPINYTAIHIWDKKTGCGSEYERIFERNGQINYKVFRYYLINSTIAAKYTYDEFYNHPAQKPIKLIRNLINKYTKENDLILDPFLGSGTTARACKDLGRKCIGIEISKEYCDIAIRRLGQEVFNFSGL